MDWNEIARPEIPDSKRAVKKAPKDLQLHVPKTNFQVSNK
jgi:hypothetical protein